MKIAVNGEEFPLKLSYDEVIIMAGYKAGRVLSVSYRSERNGDMRREGTLVPGQSIEVDGGMKFSVYDTSGA